jgi:hypothetical protein
VVGYVAARLCRKVHVERPSSSTSGGQSEGRVWLAVVLEVLGEDDVTAEDFIIAIHADEDVQVRQLHGGQYHTENNKGSA